MSDPIPLHVVVVPCLGDNYAFILDLGASVVVVDPGEAAPVAAHLDRCGRPLSHILLTHYHCDHIGGVEELRRRDGAAVIGPAPAPLSLDTEGQPGGSLVLNGLVIDVLDTPGHAFPHVAYHVPSRHWLFSGDCLFGAGCGRLAGNRADTMWASLQKLAVLPDETQVYFGHEYTLDNLAFAASVESGNPAIAERTREVRETLAAGRFSAPSTLEEEKRTNPFLRPHSREIRRALGTMDASDLEVFTALRKAKDRFTA